MANCASARTYPLSSNRNTSLIENLSTTLVEWIEKGLRYLFDIMDLKMRSVKFVSSLYTNDNLSLVKKFLNIGLRFGGWLYEVLPNTTDEGLTRFWSVLFPVGHQEDKDNDDFAYDEVDPAEDKRSVVFDADTENFVNSFADQTMDLHTLINSQ